jgi:tRNA A-37 threonylcarbamoyl transferase component Bud32
MNNTTTFTKYNITKNSKIYEESSSYKFYYAIDEIFYNEKGIPYDFKVGVKIASEGSHGKIYNTCSYPKKSNDTLLSMNNFKECRDEYILKKMIYDEEVHSSREDFRANFELEVNYQEAAASWDLSGPIVLAYVIDDENFMETGFIMKKYQKTLTSVLNDPTIDIDRKLKILDKVLNLLESLQLDARIVHNDTHTDNFMFESEDLDSLKLIDFGLSEDAVEGEFNTTDLEIFGSNLHLIKNGAIRKPLLNHWNTITKSFYE